MLDLIVVGGVNDDPEELVNDAIENDELDDEWITNVPWTSTEIREIGRTSRRKGVKRRDD